MEQKHSPELDLEFARSVLPYFRDPRDIRVDGKPMLIVYWPNVILDLSATLLLWRELFRKDGIGEVHLVSA
jgi:O-antigen biosynthesis protein